MMKKSRVLQIVLTLLLLLTLVACKKPDDPKKPDPTPSIPVENEYPDPEYVNKDDSPYINLLDTYKKEDWSGYWIWDEINAPDSYVAFRKKFTLSNDVENVKINISAESKYFLWINGLLTVYDGSAKRGPSTHDSFYDEVDISHLNKGENTLAFLVVYNGRSSDSSIDAGKAGLLFEMNVEGKVIKSDNKTKVKRLREYKNKSLLKGDYPNYPQSSMLGEWNVYYDSREGIGNFFEMNYDDSSWKQAIGLAKAGAKPFNSLYRNPAPIMKFEDIVDFDNSNAYVGKVFEKNETIELVLPLNRQFSVFFDLEAQAAGEKLIFYTDTYVVGSETNYKDTYITKKGNQKYENYPWRSGSKLYIEVPKGTKFNAIGYRPSGYDSDVTGRFVSSNENLNILWQKAVNSLLINMRDTFMDTPDRERAPYMGDASNQVEMLLYSLDTQSYEMVKKTILTAIGWTRGDGILPSRAPSKSPHEIPVQSLAFIVSAYNYYLHTGDKDTIEMFYDVAIDYLKLWNLKANGLIEIRDGSWIWTDWGEKIDIEVIQNAWYYYALNVMEKLSLELGNENNDEFLSSRKQSISNNFAKVYQKADGGFRSGEFNDDRANALAVLSGLAKKSDWPAVKEILVDIQNASPFYEKYVLEALVTMGEYETAITRMLDRYGPMIEDSGTTLWELWSLDAADTVTVNHGWTGGPLVIMSKYYAGISPTKANYEAYDIIPQFILDKIDSVVTTNKGDIKMSFEKINGTTVIKIKGIDAQGTLKLPKEFEEFVISKSEDLVKINDDNYFSLSFGKGAFEIIINK